MYNFLGWKNSWGSILDPTHPESLDLVICPSFLDPHKQLLGEMDTNPENLQMAGNQVCEWTSQWHVTDTATRDDSHVQTSDHGPPWFNIRTSRTMPPLTLTMKPDLVKHNLLWGSSIHEILKLYCIYNYHYYTHTHAYIYIYTLFVFSSIFVCK